MTHDKGTPPQVAAAGEGVDFLHWSDVVIVIMFALVLTAISRVLICVVC